MDVLLVNPSMIEGYQKIKNLSGVTPPIGLAYIASTLEKNGIGVKIIDVNALRLGEDELRNILESADFDIIGTSAFISTQNAALSVLRLAKEVKSCKTVIGGPHPTALPGEMLKRGFVDFVVRGEGEETFLELVDSIRNDRPLGNVMGVSYRKNGKVHSNPDRPLIKNLDEMPFPAYHLLPMDKYRLSTHHAIGHGRRINLRPFFIMFTSRGCPYRCTFCASHLTWKRRVRFRSPENVIEEIDFLVKNYNIRNIDFYDDTFTLDKRRTHRILDMIIERGYGIDFSCLSRVDAIDDAILSKMRRSGFFNIRYGIESGSPRMLRMMRKDIDLEKARRAIRLTQKNGMSANVFFIFGHPGETRETAMQTVDFALDAGPDFALFYNALPLPGTEMAEMVKNCRVEESSKTFTSKQAAFDTRELTREDIIRIRKMAYRRFYLRPLFIAGKLLKIRSLTELKVYAKALASFTGLVR